MTLQNLTLIVCLVGSAAAQEPFSQLRNGGPRTLVIAYRCSPDQRPALRQIMLNSGVAGFEALKKQNVLKEYHILFNSYLDSETYDMLSLLTFSDFSKVAEWKEVEKVRPGGLPQEALKLVSSAVTYSLDGVRQAASKEAPKRGKSVYFIIPYDYLIPTDDYVKYVDAYVIPQVNGWIEENVLASYSIYVSRYSTSRPWGSLFVLEYRDNDAFGMREATVTKVRGKLKSNRAWVTASENKQKVRVEKQTIIAEELLPNP
jgi:hypothetical protein